MSLIMFLFVLCGIGILLLRDALIKRHHVNTVCRGYAPNAITLDEFIKRYGASDLDFEQARCNSLGNEGEVAEIRERIKSEAGVKPTLNMVALGVIAQRGKIPVSVIKNGILTIDFKVKQELIAEREFCRWYDTELRAHGVEQPLMFISNTIKPDGTHERYTLMSKTPLGRGRYAWSSHLTLGTPCYLGAAKLVNNTNPQNS